MCLFAHVHATNICIMKCKCQCMCDYLCEISACVFLAGGFEPSEKHQSIKQTSHVFEKHANQIPPAIVAVTPLLLVIMCHYQVDNELQMNALRLST